MFKCDPNQNILAENLLLVLQSISGLRDIQKEISNDIDNRSWMFVGVYEETTSIFYLREGEQ